MPKLLLALSAFAAAVIIGFFILGLLSRSGSAAGLQQGKLSKCPHSPNCVCSEYPDDSNHYIEPIALPASLDDKLLRTIKSSIRHIGGTAVNEHGDYAAYRFTSRIFRFIDDVEIRIDRTHNRLHIRSASRVGYGDLGANRKRVELIKARVKQAIDSTA